MMFLGLGVFLIWWSLQQIPDDKWDDFKLAFKSARYWLLVPVFIVLTISHIIRAIRWKMLMEPMGYNPSLRNTFFAVMVGYFANLAIPRLGEILKCTILAKYEKVPADKLVGTIVCERAFDLLCLVILIVLAFILQFEIIGEFGLDLIGKLIKGKGGDISFTRLFILIGVVIGLIITGRYLIKRFEESRFIILIKKLLIGIWHGIISVKDLRNKWQFLFSTVAIWVLYLLGTWIGFYATVGTDGLGLEVAISGMAFGSIGMIITPGGIGTYALFMARILEENGIPFEIGFANGTLQWFGQFLLIVIMGFFSLILLPYFNKKKIQDEQTGKHTEENFSA